MRPITEEKTVGSLVKIRKINKNQNYKAEEIEEIENL
jgi:hypothetical protein